MYVIEASQGRHLKPQGQSSFEIIEPFSAAFQVMRISGERTDQNVAALLQRAVELRAGRHDMAAAAKKILANHIYREIQHTPRRDLDAVGILTEKEAGCHAPNFRRAVDQTFSVAFLIVKSITLQHVKADDSRMQIRENLKLVGNGICLKHEGTITFFDKSEPHYTVFVAALVNKPLQDLVDVSHLAIDRKILGIGDHTSENTCSRLKIHLIVEAQISYKSERQFASA